ncbi:MAG: hypothetical protein KF900_09900 [Bacteroidetes bacterium]|nr:hypothetical protein [Bacteroidota bacterium]
MKSKTILLFLAVAMLASCKQFKKPNTCIQGPETCEVGEQVTFTWCGEYADIIEWDDGQGNSGEGRTFTTSFEHKGSRSIYVRARNKIVLKGVGFRAEGEHSVKCGEKSYVWCAISNACISGGGSGTIYNTPDLANYKAYLYAGKASWANDVDNGNHNFCLDSTTCTYQQGTSGAYFKKTFPTGTEVYVSVEYRNPQTPNDTRTNWGSIIQENTGGLVGIHNNQWSDNSGWTSLSTETKKFLRGKWKLYSTQINGNSVPVPDCNKDDYIKFYANGTWKYHVGSDNCNGNSSESTGTNSVPTCSDSQYMSMSTTSGPFVAGSVALSSDLTEFTVSSNDGSNSAQFTFKYSNN